MTAAGTIAINRRYTECLPCRNLGYTADARLGLEGRYTVGLRRVAVMAGTSWSFECQSFFHSALKVRRNER